MKHLPLALLLLAQASLLRAEDTALKFEAEDGTIVKSDIVSDKKYSGEKAVKMTDGAASLTFEIEVTERKQYTVFIMSEGIGGEKVVNCSVNGAASAFKTSTYKEINAGTFIFLAGSNTLKITPNWTWFNIDYIRLEPADTEEITFDISSKPVTPDATEAAQKLYSFLYENFGKRTISGVMGGETTTAGIGILEFEEPKKVFTASGSYPALVGFDFMNATGEAVDRGNKWFTDYTRNSVDLAKKLWAIGGIPDFSWHWRDPSRETGEFYTKKTDKPNGTTFNFTTAMKSDGSWDTSSTAYKHLVKDIDDVANYFLELQKEGIACIFRPLHEAPGGWFWWGTQGAEAFVKLYRLIHDEMVKVKGVKNVIWDWNADYTLDQSWCPGEEYYDIISTDIYNDAFDYSSNYTAFNKLKDLSNGKKLVTLAENGPIPDIDKMANEDAMWSWWMPWSGEFIDKTENAQWKKCMNDERIITLGSMPGWDKYSGIDAIEMMTPDSDLQYNLNGMRVNGNAKGAIMIVNGRKVIISER